MTSHDELDCITEACAMYEVILEAVTGDVACDMAPEDELRAKMPTLLAELSPQARAMLDDHLDHVRELVAHFHRLERLYETANRSSA